MVTDSHGTPIQFLLSPGQAHESRYMCDLLERIGVLRSNGFLKTRPKALAGDKGYSFPVLRRWLYRHGIKPVIPLKSNQKGRRGRPYKLSEESYKQRNCVERLIGWIKEFRRISTRYEKLACRYAGMVRLAFIRRLWLLLE